MWQIEAAKDLIELFHKKLNIENIILGGSMLDESIIDIYSDVDMEIILKQNDTVNMREMIQALSERFIDVFGYEIYNYENKDMLRICFENGYRFDLTFLYPYKKEAYASNKLIDERIDEIIHQFWFMSFMILVKLGRNDYLIASHLALELSQLTIVVQMLIRDKSKNTNIHRFGEKEDVPILHSLIDLQIDNSLSENNNVNEILCILFNAARQMDDISLQLNSGYNRHSKTLRELLYILKICQ